MKPCDRSITRLYLLLLAPISTLLALGMTGCYTQFGSEKGDYWNYTGKPQKEEVRRVQPAVDSAAPVAQAQPQQMALFDTLPQPAPNTVINNYYYDDGWGDPWWNRYGWEHYYRRHHPGVSLTIVIGDPYWVDPWYPAYYYNHRYCDNWYWSDDYWYHPTWRGPGWTTWDPYYPYPPYPFYGCYAPSYYPDPYWYGRNPYWYGNGYGDYYGGRGYATGRSNVRTGRIGGGERRATEGGSSSGPRIDRAGAIDARNAPVNVKAPSEVAGTAEGLNADALPPQQQPSAETARAPESGQGTVSKQPSRTTETRQNPNPPSGTTETVKPRAPEREQPRAPERSRPQAPERTREEPAKRTDTPERSSERTRQSDSAPQREYHEPARETPRESGRSNEASPTRSSDSNDGSSTRDNSSHSSGRAR